MTNTRRPFYLGVELLGATQQPESWQRLNSAPGGGPDLDQLTAATTLAEAAGLDFTILADSFVPAELGNHAGAQLDAVLLSAYLAQHSRQIGIIPQVSTTWVEPFHVSKAIATLDHVSRGRAGWQPVSQSSAPTADLFGGVAPDGQAAVVELAEVTEVTKKLWDSWEDDAIIKDEETGRFVDRSKLHYVDYQGQNFFVKGPSITPRPPQGRPVTVLTAGHTSNSPTSTGTTSNSSSEVEDALTAVAVQHADLIRLANTSPDAAQQQATELQTQACAHGRNTAPLILLNTPITDTRQLASLLLHLAEATNLDGVILQPAEPLFDLKVLAEVVIPELVRAGVRPAQHYPYPTLRENLGLSRPSNIYAKASPSHNPVGA